MSVSALGEVIQSEGVSRPDSCRLAQVGYADARRERARWQMLVFVMACAFGVFLVAGIVFVSLGSDTRGAGVVALVSTVASGAAMTWMVKQRNDASIQLEKALKLVNKYCHQPDATIAELDEGADPAELVAPTA